MAASKREWPDISRAPGTDFVRLSAVRMRAADGEGKAAFDIRKPVGIELEFHVLSDGHLLIPHVSISNDEGQLLFVAAEIRSPWYLRPRLRGRYRTTAWIPGNLLAEGRYFVSAMISRWNPALHFVHEADAVRFDIIDSLDGDSARGEYGGSFPGLIRPLLEWSLDEGPSAVDGAVPAEP
jgi:lipopolysaccharide transport system ATP-binding protein